MQDSQDTIAVIGTGVIGTGWIIRFLFNKKKFTQNIWSQVKNKKFLLNEIKRTSKL